jgi:hypothetical protein
MPILADTRWIILSLISAYNITHITDVVAVETILLSAGLLDLKQLVRIDEDEEWGQ